MSRKKYKPLKVTVKRYFVINSYKFACAFFHVSHWNYRKEFSVSRKNINKKLKGIKAEKQTWWHKFQLKQQYNSIIYSFFIFIWSDSHRQRRLTELLHDIDIVIKLNRLWVGLAQQNVKKSGIRVDYLKHHFIDVKIVVKWFFKVHFCRLFQFAADVHSTRKYSPSIIIIIIIIIEPWISIKRYSSLISMKGEKIKRRRDLRFFGMG